MKAEEVLALAILPEDVAAGIAYARQSLQYTFDRMRYRANPERRFGNIAVGKMCEATLLRFLRQHGVPHVGREGATPHTRPDRFDLRVLNEIIDLKTFRAPPIAARGENLMQCLALIPFQHEKDQWLQRKKYQRFIFGFFNGEFRGRSQSQNKAFDPQSFVVQHTPAVFFVTAAPALAECEAQFAEIAAGTKCAQYPSGTRIRNMGCAIGALTSFQSFLENLEKFCRR
ncbi:hypothetical protein HUU05_07630 [candidate division KSB1 bacterium]|nr:hypothetical protein [candidate division KSB1 bacterium]